MNNLPLTKENVLKKTTEARILQQYLGLPVVFNQMFCNPLRIDKNPDCKFFQSPSGKIFFVDFAQREYGGDCFKIVQIQYECDFYEALQIINRDLKLGLHDPYADYIGKKPSFHKVYNYHGRIVEYAPKPTAQISYTYLPKFLPEDVKFWQSFGVSEKTCKLYDVKAAYEVYINKKLAYQYSKASPVYVYKFDEIHCKIYAPFAHKSKKFRNNAGIDIIQGWEQLPEFGDLLLITKSLKDVMVLHELGYSACAPQSENSPLLESQVEEMKRRFARIVIIYDNDKVGMRYGQALQECCGFEQLHMPYEEKDPSDHVFNHGLDSLGIYLNSLL